MPVFRRPLHPSVSAALLLVLSPLLAPFVQAAAVAFDPGSPVTTWESESGSSTVNSTATLTLDLSEMIGFTPGQPIEILMDPDPGLRTIVFFQSFGPGLVAINFNATVEITAGAYSMTYTEGWGLVRPGSTDGTTEGGVNGDGVPHSFIVPWGTDLSNVTVTITDTTSISGGSNNPLLFESSVALTGFLITQSVPEPSSLLLAVAAVPLAFMRRRRPPAFRRPTVASRHG